MRYRYSQRSLYRGFLFRLLNPGKTAEKENYDRSLSYLIVKSTCSLPDMEKWRNKERTSFFLLVGAPPVLNYYEINEASSTLHHHKRGGGPQIL